MKKWHGVTMAMDGRRTYSESGNTHGKLDNVKSSASYLAMRVVKWGSIDFEKRIDP